GGGWGGGWVGGRGGAGWGRGGGVGGSSGRPATPKPSAARSMQLSELGELGLLAELERRGLARGIDNDAADLGDGTIVTQDALVEDVHFRLDWLSWRDLGWRAAAVNLSDLAASGAGPHRAPGSPSPPASTERRDAAEH